MHTKESGDKPVLGVIIGDATGIGPEIVAKVAAKGVFKTCCYPVIIGDLRVLRMGMKIANVDFPYTVIESVDEADWSKGIPVLDMKNLDPSEIKIGEINPYCGQSSAEMLILAVELYKKNMIDGFCFAPLNKGAMKMAGYKFESEHMLFAHCFNWTEPFGEVNVLGNLWVSRVTSHIPIKDISSKLTVDSITRAIKLLHQTMKRAGMENARVAVSALNPHAGENGLCGTEEIDTIIPAIKEAKLNGINVSGPYSADILFIKAFNGDFDGVVTMYHDQGQIAMKLKDFEHGITISAGFPAPIVTCSHGTAYDIAGKGIAKTSAFENAVKMAAKIALCDKKVKVL